MDRFSDLLRRSADLIDRDPNTPERLLKLKSDEKIACMFYTTIWNDEEGVRFSGYASYIPQALEEISEINRDKIPGDSPGERSMRLLAAYVFLYLEVAERAIKAAAKQTAHIARVDKELALKVFAAVVSGACVGDDRAPITVPDTLDYLLWIVKEHKRMQSSGEASSNNAKLDIPS